MSTPGSQGDCSSWTSSENGNKSNDQIAANVVLDRKPESVCEPVKDVQIEETKDEGDFTDTFEGFDPPLYRQRYEMCPSYKFRIGYCSGFLRRGTETSQCRFSAEKVV